MLDTSSPWQISSDPTERKRFAWPGGVFESASRRRTAHVEGSIKPSTHLLMATMKGGARRHEFTTSDGSRYGGPDAMGSVSFLPAGCERQLKLTDVAWEWASIAIDVDDSISVPNSAFSVEREDFLFGLISSFKALMTRDGALDPLYCESMSLALRHYLGKRGGVASQTAQRVGGLTPRQLRLVREHVDANLSRAIRIADMARICELSEGYFHRAFQHSVNETPLRFVNARRVARAAEILARNDQSAVVDIALEVGFVNASHFARVFRSLMGVNPDEYRRELRTF